MKLIQAYNQSFSSVITTGAELSFNWKSIQKSRPHHKFLIRPSLVNANHLGTDITANNNTFILQLGVGSPTTYTLPSRNYTGAELATQLTTTTGTTWNILSSNKLQFTGYNETRIFSPCNNSAHQVMGFITGFNYGGTNIPLTYEVNLAPTGYLFLNYTQASSKTGNETEVRQQDGSVLSRAIQGKYQIATLPTNQTHLAEEDVCNNEGLLLDELPLTPFTITMETENGVQMTSTNRIEYNILFTIMEVDTNDEPKPITNKVVSNYIRCLSYANQTSAFVDFTSTSFFNGLVKKKPKNKWFVVCSLAIMNGSSGSGRFAQILNPSFTSKCNWIQNSSGGFDKNSRYMISMTSASLGASSRMTNVGNGLLIDDFATNQLNVIVGQGSSLNGPFNFYSVFNIYEIEYI